LSSRSLRVAVCARAGEAERSELVPDAHAVFEQHLDVGPTIDFDGLDVMGGHGSTLRGHDGVELRKDSIDLVDGWVEFVDDRS
jgi:hypothetical protein